MGVKKLKVRNLTPVVAEENRVRGKPQHLCMEDRDYYASLLARKNREAKEWLTYLHSKSVAK
jgi:hypothetical protein